MNGGCKTIVQGSSQTIEGATVRAISCSRVPGEEIVGDAGSLDVSRVLLHGCCVDTVNRTWLSASRLGNSLHRISDCRSIAWCPRLVLHFLVEIEIGVHARITLGCVKMTRGVAIEILPLR
jgi:hypothetical protein